MSVNHECEGKLQEVMEKAEEKINFLGKERTSLISECKSINESIKSQEEQNNQSKLIVQKLMDEITEQLKLKYELEHDVSKIYNKKIHETKILSKMKDELRIVEAKYAEEVEKEKKNLLTEQKKKELLIDKKKEELAKEYIENDKLKEQLKEYKEEIASLKGELNIVNEKEKSLERRSKHCSTALNNVFKYSCK